LKRAKGVLMIGFFAGLIYGKCAVQLIRDRNKDTA